MHSRYALRRVDQRANEDDAQPEKPLHHVGGVIREDCPQCDVVAGNEGAGMCCKVFEMVMRVVAYSGASLLRCINGGNGANAPVHHAAEIRSFLAKNDRTTGFRSFVCRGEP